MEDSYYHDRLFRYSFITIYHVLRSDVISKCLSILSKNEIFTENNYLVRSPDFIQRYSLNLQNIFEKISYSIHAAIFTEMMF